MLHGINVIKYPGIYDIEFVLSGPSHQNPAGFITPVNANHFLLENRVAKGSQKNNLSNFIPNT